MSAETVLFLVLRPLHVLLAAAWIGSAIFMSYLLMPAIEATGPAGGQVMLRLNRNGLVTFFGSVAGLTVVTGLYLYWRFTGGNSEVILSHGGLAFGIGGIAGILAAIVGGAVIGRASKQMVDIMTRAATMRDGGEKAGLLATAEQLRHRLASAGTVVVVLQVIALVLMALGHYI